MSETHPFVFDWELAVEVVPAGGRQFTKAASAGERSKLAEVLNLLSCEALAADLAVRPLAGGRYRVKGRVRAELVQACVVTLDPVTAWLDEPVDVEFRPAEDISDPVDGAIDLDSELELEPIIQGRLAIGRVVFEHVAAAIDPYPRRPGAALSGAEIAGGPAVGSGRENPFAVLAQLKKDR